MEYKPLNRRQQRQIDELHRRHDLKTIRYAAEQVGADFDAVKQYIQARRYTTNFKKKGAIFSGAITAGLTVMLLSLYILTHRETEPITTPLATVVAETPTYIAPTEVPVDYITFGQAKENPSLRQPYIDRIVREHGLPKYVPSVEYVDTQEELEILKSREYQPSQATQAVTETLAEDIENIGRRIVRSRVLVLPEAFEASDVKNEKDFIAVLFDKEFNNARCAYEGFGTFGIEKLRIPHPERRIYNLRLLKSVIELCGYKGLADNVDNLGAVGISPNKRRSINIDYMKYYADIWNHENVGQESLDFLKVTYFQPWMQMIRGFGIEQSDGTERWFITTPEGKKLFLPDAVKSRAR